MVYIMVRGPQKKVLIRVSLNQDGTEPMTTELLITRRMSGQTVAMDSLSSLTENEPYLEKKTWLALKFFLYLKLM